MNTSENKYDPIESVIFENGLRIVGVHFYTELDLMLVVLNNKKVLTTPISKSMKLLLATEDQRKNYTLLGDGVAIHWPDIDEDISLKGLLQEELARAGRPLAA